MAAGTCVSSTGFVHQGRKRRADRRPLGHRAPGDGRIRRPLTRVGCRGDAEGRFGAEMVAMTLDGEVRTSDSACGPVPPPETLVGLKPAFRTADGRSLPEASPISGRRRGGKLLWFGRGRRPARPEYPLDHRPDHRRRRSDHHADRTIPATRKLLERNGWSSPVDDIDLFEVNEAFSRWCWLAAGTEGRPRSGQRQRRSDRAGHAVGATGATDRHPGRPNSGARGGSGPGHDVLWRRAGHRTLLQRVPT